MFSICLAGVRQHEWREKLKTLIDSKLTVCDPYVIEWEDLTSNQNANQLAKEIEYIHNGCKLVIFYIDSSREKKSILMEIGECVAKNKSIILCLDGDVEDKEDIQQYCEYHGIITTYSFQEFVSTINDYFVQVGKCEPVLVG